MMPTSLPPMNISAGGGGPSGASGSTSTNPFNNPFNQDFSGWNVNIRSSGSQTSSGNEGNHMDGASTSAGMSAGGGLGGLLAGGMNMQLLMLGALAFVLFKR